jgi:tetratricopeptide (TPR) repeat protein
LSQTQPPDLSVPGGDEAGLGFKVEMAVQNFFLGYWKHLVAIVVIGLIGTLIYGQAKSWQQGQQRAASAQIAAIEADLRDELAKKLDPMSQTLLEQGGYSLQGVISVIGQMPPEQQQQVLMMSPGGSRLNMTLMTVGPEAQSVLGLTTDQIDTVLLFLGEPDDESRATMIKSADALVALANESGGAAAVEALLEAAELYRVAGNADQRKVALEQAAAATDEGVLHYAAVTGLAHAELEAGQADQAITRLRDLAKGAETESPFLAQEATFELASALEEAGKADEAGQVYTEFLTKWPDSPRADDVKRRQARPAKEG